MVQRTPKSKKGKRGPVKRALVSGAKWGAAGTGILLGVSSAVFGPENVIRRHPITEWRLDKAAHEARAPGKRGELERAVSRFANVETLGKIGANRTIYVIPQMHPEVNTGIVRDEAAGSQADMHFILDELKGRGARFLYGEGVPNVAAAELLVMKSFKPGESGGEPWRKWVTQKTAEGDWNAIRDFYGTSKNGTAYFAREKLRPTDFRLQSFGHEFPYGIYLQDLYGEMNNAIISGVDPMTGKWDSKWKEKAQETGRKIHYVNRLRSLEAADHLVKASERGDVIGALGSWHVPDMREHLKGKIPADVQIKILWPRSIEQLERVPTHREYYSPRDGMLEKLEHGEPTKQDKDEVKRELSNTWDKIRESATDGDLRAWKSPE
jgi:hypothetical protein